MELEEHHIRQIQYAVEKIFITINSDKHFHKLRGMYIIPTKDDDFRRVFAIFSAETRMAIARVFEKYVDNPDIINNEEVKKPKPKSGAKISLEGWKIERETEDL